jgi:hypothetical protein
VKKGSAEADHSKFLRNSLLLMLNVSTGKNLKGSKVFGKLLD